MFSRVASSTYCPRVTRRFGIYVAKEIDGTDLKDVLTTSQTAVGLAGFASGKSG
jgi:hypothetical protein